MKIGRHTLATAAVASALALTAAACSSSSGTSAASATGTPTASSSSVRCGDKPMEILSPTEGSRVNGDLGIVVHGRACGLKPDESIWLLDHTLGEQYYVDYTNFPRPLTVVNGRWSFRDKPFGDAGASNELVQIILVRADTACASTLATYTDKAGDFALWHLPPGCSLVDVVSLLSTR